MSGVGAASLWARRSFDAVAKRLTSCVRLRRCAYVFAWLLAAFVFGINFSHAQAPADATWISTATAPASWNTGSNWSTASVPTGIATFSASTTTTRSVSFSASATIDQMLFVAGAPAYTFDLSLRNLEFTGAGIINNSSNAPTFNNVGLLQFDGTSTAANAIINLTPGAATFIDSSTAGTALITTSNSGAVYFTDTSTAGSATIINDDNGLTRFSTSATAGTATITTNNNGQTVFRDTSNAGTATLIVNNGGTVTFQDTATAQNATITVNNGGTVAFATTSTGDNARFIINLGGTFDISGLDAGYNGMTVGSIEGAGTFCICDHLLTVGSNNLSTQVSGVIDGLNGSLTKVGTGPLTLSGTNTYTGTTTVNAGTLIVNGSIAASSLLTVNANATLGGTGTIPTTIINGGTLSPGNSIGTITISSDLTFVAPGIYLVEIGPGVDQNDRTNVSGTATLAGTLRAFGIGGVYTVGRRYTVLNAANGIIGTFGTLDIAGNFGFTRPRITYDANNVYIVLDPNTLTPSLPAGTSTNVTNVARAIDAIIAAGNAPADFGVLFGLSSSSLVGVLTQLTGEIGTGMPRGALLTGGHFLSLMLSPFVKGRPGFTLPGSTPLGYASESPTVTAASAVFASVDTAADPRWTVWGSTFGAQNVLNGDNGLGSHQLDTRTVNIATGFDYRFGPATTVGFSIAAGRTNFSLSDGLGGGSGDNYLFGVYGTTQFDDVYLAAAATLGRFDYSTDRSLAFAGINSRLFGDFIAYGAGLRTEIGRRFAVASVGLTPFAAVQTQTLRKPAYNEQVASGSTAFALNYDAQTANRTRSELGVSIDGTVPQVAALSLFGRGAWVHEFIRDDVANVAFQTDPTNTFAVNGATLAAEALLVSGGADWRITDRILLRGEAEGEFTSNSRTYTGTATLRVSW